MAEVIKALAVPRRRRSWVKGVDAGLVSALSAALDSAGSKGIVVRADGLGRFRYKWDNTVVQIHLLPKPGGKVSIVATNMKLAGAAMVAERRDQWRVALAALATLLAA